MNNLTIKISAVLLFAISIYSIMYSGVFYSLSNTVSDSLYQTETTPDSRIVIIGIDEKALSAYGEFPWDRKVFADAIEYLNKDENNRPDVIGVDVLFSTLSENDEELIAASQKYDNVVLASYADFGVGIEMSDNGAFYLNNYVINSFHLPFEGIYSDIKSGHVNAMMDTDGVLRHAIWQIELANGEIVPSFNRLIANEYAKVNGLDEITVPPLDARQRWYVLQQAGPGAYYDNVSVLDLVNQSVPTSYFADKIVLIGPYEPGLLDEYSTPISTYEKMYGVEFQANAISALLNENVKREVSFLFQTIITIILTCIALVFFFNLRFFHSLVFWAVTVAMWFFICILLFNLGFVFQVIYVPIFVSAALLFSTGLNYNTERFAKNKLANTFNRYVAPQIVAEILKEDKQSLQLGGKVANVAVMFADMRGFTPLASKLPPKVVVEIINSYLTVLSECIFEHNGTLDKYIGDCTMAFWGAPLPQKKSAQKAVMAGIDIIKRSKEIAKSIEKKYGYYIEVGVGISYGSAVVGNIGSHTRMDYTVIGDTVNIASRLEAAVPGGHIYVDSNIVSELENKNMFEKLEENIKLKGKEDNFNIYSLKSEYL